jgi:arginase
MNKLLTGAIIMAIAATAMGETNTVRLVFPQWQGARMQDGWIPEVKDLADASRGYALGSRLLEVLAPENPGHKTVRVPVCMEYGERKITDGITDLDAIVSQTKSALAALEAASPDRVITLGGECSVSVVPFAYLARRYAGDVSVLWIDAHPDITLPGDVYPAYHAMAVTAIMGKVSPTKSILPAAIPPERILFVGLRDWERQQIVDRQKEYGMKHLAVADMRESSKPVLDWLKAAGAKHVLIHFDLDVLDPAEIIPAVGVVKDGMKMAEVVRLINDVSVAYDVAALTVAEPLPRTAINLRNMLHGINLFK